MSVWFVTGASRGFGMEIVAEALRRGHQVVATARNPDAVTEAFPQGGDNLITAALDVHDAQQIQAAVHAGIDAYGRIDVLVNNAGRGLVGAIEETSDAEARATFDVNVFGLFEVTKAILPQMREQRSGLIVNMSSVGGFVAWAGWGVYCASKFAVEGLSDALGLEVAPFGIRVTAIEPGPFRTDFLDGSSLQVAHHQIEDYAQSGGSARTWATESNARQAGDPAKAAKIILDLDDRAEVPPRIQLGAAAINDVAAKLRQTSQDQQIWRETGLSADFSTAGAPGQ